MEVGEIHGQRRLESRPSAAQEEVVCRPRWQGVMVRRATEGGGGSGRWSWTDRKPWRPPPCSALVGHVVRLV